VVPRDDNNSCPRIGKPHKRLQDESKRRKRRCRAVEKIARDCDQIDLTVFGDPDDLV
jgi:hypothetical protein